MVFSLFINSLTCATVVTVALKADAECSHLYAVQQINSEAIVQSFNQNFIFTEE